MKDILFFIGTVLKVILILSGLGVAIFHLTRGGLQQDNYKKRTALKYFLGTVIGTVLITALEFIIISFV